MCQPEPRFDTVGLPDHGVCSSDGFEGSACRLSAPSPADYCEPGLTCLELSGAPPESIARMGCAGSSCCLSTDGGAGAHCGTDPTSGTVGCVGGRSCEWLRTGPSWEMTLCPGTLGTACCLEECSGVGTCADVGDECVTGPMGEPHCVEDCVTDGDCDDAAHVCVTLSTMTFCGIPRPAGFPCAEHADCAADAYCVSGAPDGLCAQRAGLGGACDMSEPRSCAGGLLCGAGSTCVP